MKIAGGAAVPPGHSLHLSHSPPPPPVPGTPHPQGFWERKQFLGTSAVGTGHVPPVSQFLGSSSGLCFFSVKSSVLLRIQAGGWLTMSSSLPPGQWRES